MDSLPMELQVLCWNLIDENVQKQLPLTILKSLNFLWKKDIKSWSIVKKNLKKKRVSDFT